MCIVQVTEERHNKYSTFREFRLEFLRNQKLRELADEVNLAFVSDGSNLVILNRNCFFP